LLPDTEIRWEKTTAVAVKIKLKRLGKIRAPYYRIVVADARTKRDGRAIEEIGKYHPKAEPSFIEVNSERAQHWLSVGAQPTDPVRKLLEITGDWQKFKGLPGAEGTLRFAEPKTDRKAVFAEALQETLEAGGSSSKPKSRAKASDSGAPKGGRGGKSDSPKADSPKADSPKADSPKADSPKADSPKAGKADAGKADSAKAGAAKADSAKADSGKADVAKADSAKADSAKAESGQGDKAKAKASADAEPTAEAGDSASSEG
jgi:small subunit ribosomal protein S16